jgi:hypothetical protein
LDRSGLGYNGCTAVNDFSSDGGATPLIVVMNCSHFGGRLVEPNCLTASYQIQ